MFGLFKKKTAVENTTAIKQETINIVEQIHNDFNSEVNRILQDCGIVLESEEKYQSIIEKAKVMRDLGFHNAKTAVVGHKENKDIEDAKRNIRAIKYFQEKYPLYRLITKESITKLCEKYDLYCASAGNYIDDIPDKNLKEIQRFKISKLDATHLTTDFHAEIAFPSFYLIKDDLIRESDFSIKSELLKRIREYNLQNKEEQEKYFEFLDNRSKYYEKDYCIVAPLRMFKPNTKFDRETRFEQRHGHRLDKDGNLIPDPIVLKSVMFENEEYFLIVSAWGDEASDPLVVNSKMN